MIRRCLHKITHNIAITDQYETVPTSQQINTTESSQMVHDDIEVYRFILLLKTLKSIVNYPLSIIHYKLYKFPTFLPAILLLPFFLLLSVFCSIAQPADQLFSCSHARSFSAQKQVFRSASDDKRMENYDVKYVKLDLQLDNLSTYTEGEATTIAEVVNEAITEYVFELIEALTIDSLKINNQLLPVYSDGAMRQVHLPERISPGALFTVQVYYRGTPPKDPEFFINGIHNEISEEWDIPSTYTLSQPYAAKDWWPCKQVLTDKIDSSDVWITVPAALKAGSNGILERITTLPGDLVRYEWKSRYPIDYYLISVAVSAYMEYSYYIRFDDSNDSMLFQNYIYDHPEILNVYKEEIDSTALMIQYFSELFGRYPFWKEKYGHSLVTLGGGMEHQTMTTQGNFGSGLTAHELGHQWFGNYVTCGTWSDIWLNEGLATYIEYIFIDRFHGREHAIDKMKSTHEYIRSEEGGSVYCWDVMDVRRLFSGRLTYAKAGAMVHSLRFIVNNDSLFFEMLRAYLDRFAHNTATTEQFKHFAAQYVQQDLDTFFNQWIYGEGYPVYKAWWNQNDNQVFLRLEQTTSTPESISLFRTPLAIRLVSSTSDTMVRIYNNDAVQYYSLTWNHPVDHIEIDPEYHILKSVDSIRRDHALLSVQGFDTTLFLVYPNPSAGYWTIDGMPAECDLRLTDMSGKILWQGNNEQNNSIRIDGQLFATGQYLLHIYKKGSANQVIRLVNTK